MLIDNTKFFNKFRTNLQRVPSYKLLLMFSKSTYNFQLIYQINVNIHSEYQTSCEVTVKRQHFIAFHSTRLLSIKVLFNRPLDCPLQHLVKVKALAYLWSHSR